LDNFVFERKIIIGLQRRMSMSKGINLKTRDEIEGKYKWKVEKLYANDNIWEEDFFKLQKLASGPTKYKGKLHESKVLLEYL
jgi:hypothetical protein